MGHLRLSPWHRANKIRSRFISMTLAGMKDVVLNNVHSLPLWGHCLKGRSAGDIIGLQVLSKSSQLPKSGRK